MAAPLSMSSDLRVALSYTYSTEKRLIFKLQTRDALERGADLKYLSAFPGESEFLFPPMTFLKATGSVQRGIELTNGVRFDVVEVMPIQGT